ncbi:MAG TPA: sigma-70 family RNA polymerase sigma factor, partial [Thermoleophilaceae bacterium]|nr:sigma-70 family RNA polymerase sigma factor [Thermoleophilaceae bacterium]
SGRHPPSFTALRAGEARCPDGPSGAVRGPDDEARGTADAFARLYRAHVAGVYGAALRVIGREGEAEDIAQEVFLRFWRDPGRFDPARGDLGPYLRLMARSRALDLWRQEQAAGRARERLKLVSRDQEVRPDERPAAVAEHREESRAVHAALRQLPPEQREALVLSYWGALGPDEIARRTGVPFGTARSRMRLGLEKLRRDATSVLAEPR